MSILPVVVGVHCGPDPSVHQLLEQVGFQVRHSPGEHVAPGAFQRYAVFGQPSHHLGVVNGLDPVSDAVCPQFIEGDQDVFRCTRHVGFAGVDGDAKPLGLGFLKQRCKGGSRVGHLVVRQVHAHKVRLALKDPIAPKGVVFHRFDAFEAGPEPHNHGVGGLCTGHATQDGLEHAVGVHGGVGVQQEGGA